MNYDSDFFQLVPPKLRQSYLHRLPDIMATDNSRNWRYRMEVAEQMILLCDMFPAEDLSEYVVPAALTLSSDKVAEVRHVAYNLVCTCYTC